MGATNFELLKHAYNADDLIEIMEEEGYIKENELRSVIVESYMEDVVPFSLEEYVEYSMTKILKHSKYKEFLRNEIKMCSKCGKIKPLSSYRKNHRAGYIDGRIGLCFICESNYHKEYWHNSEERRKKSVECRKRYVENNREEFNAKRAMYYKANRERINRQKNESRAKRSLIKDGFLGVDDENVKDIMKMFYDIKASGGFKTMRDIALDNLQELNLRIPEGVIIERSPLGRNRKLDHEKIVEQLKAGVARKEIAKEHNCSIPVVRDIAIKYGIRVNNKCEISIEEIKKLTIEGKKQAEISEILNINLSTLKRFIQKNGGKKALLAD